MFSTILQILGVIFILLIVVFIYYVIKDLSKKNKVSDSSVNNDINKKDSENNIGNELEINKIDSCLNSDELNRLLDELNSLEGLEEIKLEVNEMVSVLKYDLEEGNLDLKSITNHYVFSGNPGTGKTTVARLITDIYKTLGILSSGQLVEVDRSDLVAGYIGQTAIQTKEKVDEAMGGVLFIDEAYALSGKGNKDFGIEAVETLLKAMEDHKGEFMVIVAGYTNKMNEFLSSNPGLKSRFDKEFVFKDFNTETLVNIANKIFENKEKSASNEVYKIIKDYLDFIKKQSSEGFGNAREVRKIVSEAIKNQKIRLSKIHVDLRTEEMKKTILTDDIEEFKVKNLSLLTSESKS
jgi:SpoVK/Ycf46/Vps4 family AAA+-type ATPase